MVTVKECPAKTTAQTVYSPASAPDYVPIALLRELQLSRLKNIVTRAWERVPHFRARLDERGLTPD